MYFGIRLTTQKNIMCVNQIKDTNVEDYPLIVRIVNHPDSYGNGYGTLCFEKMDDNPFGNWELREGRISWNWNNKWCKIVFADKYGETHEMNGEYYHRYWADVIHATFQKFIDVAKLTDAALLANIVDNRFNDTIKKSKFRVGRSEYDRLLTCYFNFIQQYNKAIACDDVWGNASESLKRKITTMVDDLTNTITQITVKE